MYKLLIALAMAVAASAVEDSRRPPPCPGPNEVYVSEPPNYELICSETGRSCIRLTRNQCVCERGFVRDAWNNCIPLEKSNCLCREGEQK